MTHNVQKTINGQHAGWLSTVQTCGELMDVTLKGFETYLDEETSSAYYVDAYDRTIKYTVVGDK
jgi:hypothetical protein